MSFSLDFFIFEFFLVFSFITLSFGDLGVELAVLFFEFCDDSSGVILLLLELFELGS